ncbi:DUF2188 domain-containing protein [Halobacillus kuroshimensis]|uniref:DUF2188 domain-containing protein n=1 Tax=Halobacillus kuroshimensis TaxID=302481 RepID=A0ABS3DX78_9BACI|nr:DUF2188 domain-containing protein [Halobacillus kuroshimensis]MBN8235952.1 DUF2188 domain-containing protein [Halobacillus kuroshimensis]
MPWDNDDYPSSLKNLDTAVRKKAIDIANAMLDEGYEEGRAIPIAIEQAKEWSSHADEEERKKVKQMSDKALRSRGEDQDGESESRPELMDKGEHVLSHDQGWAVKAEGAEKPSNVYETKQEAVNRAKEIAENKGTQVIIHKKDGSIQNKQSF